MAESLTYRIGAIGLGFIGNRDWEYTGQERFSNFSSREAPTASIYH